MSVLIDNLMTGQAEFWRKYLRITDGEGGLLHVAWPLLRYDGWQVSFTLDPGASTSGVWRVTDNGTTLRLLKDMGASGHIVQAHVTDRCRAHAISCEDEELFRLKTAPFSACELQLFAEGIQVLSFLAYRAEPAHGGLGVARRNFQALVRARGYKVRSSRVLPGKLRSQIEFDEVIEAGTLCACKIFEMQHELTRNLDAWAFRLDDVKARDEHVSTILIYNPDAGHWSGENVEFGRRIADHFIPYADTARIEAALGETA